MSNSTSDIQELPEFENGSWTEVRNEYQSLPRADGGRQAWLFLTGCFLLEAFIWGFPFSYGVFQVYYSHHELFANNKTGIAAIGTTQTGIMYLSCPIVAIGMQRWPHLRRKIMRVAAVVMVVSLIAASFCDTVPSLLATQGIVYALGGTLLYIPCIQFIDEWFVARKGLAYGIMWAGTGLGGVVVPFLLQWLLDSYDFRTALRVWASIMAIGFVPCLLFVKGRLPTTSTNAFRPNDLSFMKYWAFWLFEIGAIMQSLAHFLPALWIPSFALDIGLPKFSGPLGLALINLATCIGCLFMGLSVDRFHISVAIFVSTLGQMLALFVLWGLTASQPMLYVFSLAWGIFGGGYSSTWSGFAAAIKQRDQNGHVDTGLVVSLMAAGRGVGAIISGPLSEILLQTDWNTHASFAYGTSYGILIVFSGVTATFGGAACVGRLFKII